MSQRGEKMQGEQGAEPAPASNGAEEIEQDFLRGLVYAHNRANANTAEVHQANATLQALVELLVQQGRARHGGAQGAARAGLREVEASIP